MRNIICRTLLILSLSIYSLNCMAAYDRRISEYYNSGIENTYPIIIGFNNQNKKQVDYIYVKVGSKTNDATCIQLRPCQVEEFKAKIAEMRDMFSEWSEIARKNSVKNMTAKFKLGFSYNVYWVQASKKNASLTPDFVVDTEGNCMLQFNCHVFVPGFFSCSNFLNWKFRKEEDFNNLINALDLDKFLSELNQESLFTNDKPYYYTKELPQQQQSSAQKQKEIKKKAAEGALERWKNAARSASKMK